MAIRKSMSKKTDPPAKKTTSATGPYKAGMKTDKSVGVRKITKPAAPKAKGGSQFLPKGIPAGKPSGRNFGMSKKESDAAAIKNADAIKRKAIGKAAEASSDSLMKELRKKSIEDTKKKYPGYTVNLDAKGNIKSLSKSKTTTKKK